MKSGGAIGLIIGIRPKLEGAAVHWRTDQQQRQEQESDQSCTEPEVVWYYSFGWICCDLELITNIILCFFTDMCYILTEFT